MCRRSWTSSPRLGPERDLALELGQRARALLERRGRDASPRGRHRRDGQTRPRGAAGERYIPQTDLRDNVVALQLQLCLTMGHDGWRRAARHRWARIRILVRCLGEEPEDPPEPTEWLYSSADGSGPLSDEEDWRPISPFRKARRARRLQAAPPLGFPKTAPFADVHRHQPALGVASPEVMTSRSSLAARDSWIARTRASGLGHECAVRSLQLHDMQAAPPGRHRGQVWGRVVMVGALRISSIRAGWVCLTRSRPGAPGPNRRRCPDRRAARNGQSR